jgi:hypothetical protein
MHVVARGRDDDDDDDDDDGDGTATRGPSTAFLATVDCALAPKASTSPRPPVMQRNATARTIAMVLFFNFESKIRVLCWWIFTPHPTDHQAEPRCPFTPSCKSLCNDDRRSIVWTQLPTSMRRPATRRKKILVGSHIGAALIILIVVVLAVVGKKVIHTLKTHPFVSWEWVTALCALGLGLHFLPKPSTGDFVTRQIARLDAFEVWLLSKLRGVLRRKKH